jgi:hypothetical protein
MGGSTAIVAATAILVAAGLRSRVGLPRAAAMGIAAAMLSASAVGLVLLDLEALHSAPLRAGLAGAALVWTAVVIGLRRRWPVRPPAPRDAATTWLGALGLVMVLGVGTGLRLDPSPYLHGGQDQGIYVAVGHHIAATGRLRPVDPLMAGQVRGIDQALVHAAHRIAPVEEGSPLEGVREGRWIAGLHVEDASEGRVVPAFFHLLPVWFAMTELDLGFGRATWGLVLLAALSQLAAFGVGHALAAGDGRERGARRRGVLVGLLAAGALALHPLDLWISTFTVSENLARPALLGAAALALSASAAERAGEPGAGLQAGLSGACFAAGAFARGSMLALAIVLAGALVLVRTEAATAGSRRVLLWTLVVGSTLAATQAIVCSWPYFFSAASNHFHVPRIRPYKAEAVAWAVVAAGTVLAVDALVTRARRRWPKLARTDGVVSVIVGLAWLGALLAAAYRTTLEGDGYGPTQHAASVLVRYGGLWGVGLGLVALPAAPWRAGPDRQPWIVLAAAILVVTGLKEGIRYEFYYARYLVADAIPVLVIAGAWGLGVLARRVAVRWGAWPAAGVWALGLLAWWLPPLRVLDRPVFWTRDLAHPEDLVAMLERVPDDAVLLFDAREPGRWRGILATPAFVAFGKQVLVYPSARMVERAINAGTPVYMISGGWEPEDHQRWPNERGAWRTTVVARGYYRARRAEVVEGDMPRALVEWGGPWELLRFDPSIWRGHGAFSLLPGSRFVGPGRPGQLRTVPLPLRWRPGARVELHVPAKALAGCVATAALERYDAEDEGAPASQALPLPRVSEPGASPLVFAMPEPPAASPLRGALVVRWACEREAPPELPWRRLSMRWEPG